MQHIIKKQVIELQIDKDLDAFKIQQQVSNHYLQQIVPTLQKEFDAITNEDEILIIDKLEIDLGTISATEINSIKTDNAFIKKTLEQTIEHIKKEKAFGGMNKLNTMPANSYRQWFFYMQKGYLPWNVLQPNEKWYIEVLQQLATDFNSVEKLRKEIIENKTFATRIAQEHTVTFLLQLVGIITSKNQDALSEIINEICSVLNKANNENQDKKNLTAFNHTILWQQVLLITATGQILSTTNIGSEVLKNYITSHQYKINSENIKLLNESVLLKPIIKQLQHEKILTTNNIATEKIKKKIISTDEEINIKKNKKEAAMKANEQVQEEGIFTTLAGLVLLHPFLSSLFAVLNLLQNKQFINLQAQEKAINILYYLATGNTAAEEYELIIPKILCGFPIENIITKSTDLSAVEMEEADGLLTAVIAQWNILKNTSPTGLREGFLKRNGKVFTKNTELYIQVETGSIDMLLDQLPWGLNIIKLPWIKNIIRTEWR